MDNNSKTFVNKIRILHCNVCGLRSKFMEIKNLVNKNKPHIIILNECKVDFEKYKYNILGYDKITDTTQPHLGTAMYIQRGLRWCQIELLPGIDEDQRKIEGLAISLNPNHANSQKIIIRGLYIPHVRFQQLRDEIELLTEDDDALNIGDLNLKMTRLGHSRTVGTGKVIERMIEDDICTIIADPNPSRPNHTGNTVLDAAIATGIFKHMVHSQTKQLDSITSDHLPWLLTVHIPLELEDPPKRQIKQLKTDYQTKKLFIQLLDEKMRGFDNLTSDQQVEDFIKHVEISITDSLNITAPYKRFNRIEELPQEIQLKISIRNRLKTLTSRIRNPEIKRLYNLAKKQVHQALNTMRENTWNKIIESYDDNKKKMWKIQKSLKKPPLKLPLLPNCTTEKQTIDTLVDTAIVKNASISEHLQTSERHTPFFPILKCNVGEVKRAIFLFKNKKAPGPDGIQADILKLGGLPLWNALTKIINYTLSTGYYPERWKVGECIFLHKAGKNYKEPASYRPITLLNIMGKVCERIMLQRLQTECLAVIPHHQHGFMRGKGTGTQILRTCKYITDALDQKHSVAMISTDLSKAFDSINHSGLITKLIEANISNNYIKLIENYLLNRKTRGKFRTTIGEELRVPHGVPQGSILGPFIFNLYVHDLPVNRVAGQMLSQYADDLCILNASERPNNASRRAVWACEEIIDYYDKWGLHCNVEKTECIMFTKKRKKTLASRGYDPSILIKGQQFEYKNKIKYLGVILDKNLSLNEQVKNTLKKVKQVRGMLSPIIGWYSKINIETKLLVIQSCLIPILDYGIVQTLPRISKTNILTLERQYRQALKTAAQLPRRCPTNALWEMLDCDPWHIRIHDLHNDMISKLKNMQIQDLTDPGAAYTKYGQYNPMLPSTRIGDINYVHKIERDKPVSKRLVPHRPPLI